MPSLNTRVNLTLPNEVIEILDRMGKATGAGRATIVREWLIEASPQLGEFAKALELASNKNADAFAVMAKVLNETTAQSEQLVLDIKRDRRAYMRKRAK
jgi:predicted DNA-binding protein